MYEYGSEAKIVLVHLLVHSTLSNKRLEPRHDATGFPAVAVQGNHDTVAARDGTDGNAVFVDFRRVHSWALKREFAVQPDPDRSVAAQMQHALVAVVDDLEQRQLRHVGCNRSRHVKLKSPAAYHGLAGRPTYASSSSAQQHTAPKTKLTVRYNCVYNCAYNCVIERK